MKRFGFLLILSLLVVTVAPVAVPPASATPPEWCLAVNPGQPTCSFTAMGTPEVISGAVGTGSWLVVVKRGKIKMKYEGAADGSPTALGFTLQPGDKVTATAKTPGSAVVTGWPY